jgi:hypothetical protein
METIDRLVDFRLDGPNTSRKLFDIYALSHFVHGYLFYLLLSRFTADYWSILLIGIGLELAWEWFENTPYIIRKHRSQSEFKNYRGDSVINVAGDVAVALFGLLVSLYSPDLGLAISVVLELVTVPFRANFLYLSLGSLLSVK